MRVLQRLQQHAKSQPDAIAFSLVGPQQADDDRLSYQQLADAVASVADNIERSTEADAVVMIQLVNGLAYPAAYLGVLAAGRTVFPLHPALTGHEVEEAAEKSNATCLITDNEQVDSTQWIGSEQVHQWMREPTQGLNVQVLSNRPAGAMLLQSSGTTGLPKIVERSADSIDAVARNVADSVGLGPGDRVIAAIPMCHSYGIENAVVGPVWAGATVRVCNGFDPDAVARVWSDEPGCVFPAVPVMVELLADREGLPGPRAMKAVYAAGATLPASVESAFKQRFGVRVGQLYGATEIGSVTYEQPLQTSLPEGCVGKVMQGVSLRVLDLDAPADHPPLAPGQEGQVAVSAPSMLSRYLGGQPTPMIDGHVLTGDLGRLDSDGSLHITGRVKTLIEVGGMKVNPLEIEGVLNHHPGIRECVVVPVPVSQTLSRVTAYFVPEDHQAIPGSAELRDFARQQLAGYKIPRAFKPIDELPRSSLGKVRRAALVEARV